MISASVPLYGGSVRWVLMRPTLEVGGVHVVRVSARLTQMVTPSSTNGPNAST